MKKFLIAAVLTATALISSPTQGAGTALTSEIKAIDDGWAQVAYQPGSSRNRADALDKLDRRAAALIAKYPNSAEPLLWRGIVLGEMAKHASVLRKLGLANRARDALTRAYVINPAAANGGAAMGLGVLYYQVPGSPIAFGDKGKARTYLRQALAIDPDGLNTNYFYGDFLSGQGDKAGARAHLLKALKAPADPSRPLWDAGRRAEARRLLAKLR